MLVPCDKFDSSLRHRMSCTFPCDTFAFVLLACTYGARTSFDFHLEIVDLIETVTCPKKIGGFVEILYDRILYIPHIVLLHGRTITIIFEIVLFGILFI